MLEGADERFRVEGLLARSSARLSRCGYGGVGEVLDKVLDYKVFALQRSASIHRLCEFWLTENLSRVNWGPRPDVLEVVWVRMEAVSRADVVRSAGSIRREVEVVRP